MLIYQLLHTYSQQTLVQTLLPTTATTTTKVEQRSSARCGSVVNQRSGDNNVGSTSAEKKKRIPGEIEAGILSRGCGAFEKNAALSSGYRFARAFAIRVAGDAASGRSLAASPSPEDERSGSRLDSRASSRQLQRGRSFISVICFGRVRARLSLPPTILFTATRAIVAIMRGRDKRAWPFSRVSSCPLAPSINRARRLKLRRTFGEFSAVPGLARRLGEYKEENTC